MIGDVKSMILGEVSCGDFDGSDFLFLNFILYHSRFDLRGSPSSLAGKESICKAGDLGSIPGWGRSPGEEMGSPLQYSWASLAAQTVKNLPAMQVGKVPWRRAW